jgi:hypothetical protein
MKRYLPVILLVLFLAIRIPGIGIPYYQDEWKNVSASASIQSAGQFFAHPPLMQMLFVADRAMFGIDGFRLLPLIFAALSLWLLYIAVRNRAGQSAGLWAMLFGVFCFYNILGALQTDVDGSILPFCFLLAVIAYDKIRADLFLSQADRKQLLRVNGWVVVLALALLVGMLTKLSFVLVISVFVLDHLWENRRNHVGAQIGRLAGYCIALGAIYIGLLYAIQALYPAFSISFMLGHAQQFAGTGGRNWTQIIVQAVKALYYVSPLVIAPCFLATREALRKARPFLIYLIVGCIFYFVLFDFSQGALDKYLMFATVPLIAIAAVSLSEAVNTCFTSENKGKLSAAIGTGIPAVLVLAGLAVWTNLLHPIAVPLYPKAEWFGRVAHGHWNILTPITGGSGPMGFYVSFLFIATAFIVAVVAAVVGRLALKGRFGERGLVWLVPMLCVIIAVGLAYNAVFAEEYMFGAINGSSAKVLSADVEFIRQTPLIKQVMTYNDTGAGALTAIDAYAGRIYATPDAEDLYRSKFAGFSAVPGSGYLVVDVPRLAADSFYAKFFASCTVLYQSVSGQISGTVYRCSKP